VVALGRAGNVAEFPNLNSKASEQRSDLKPVYLGGRHFVYQQDPLGIWMVQRGTREKNYRAPPVIITDLLSADIGTDLMMKGLIRGRW
jgi:hypothetical protein